MKNNRNNRIYTTMTILVLLLPPTMLGLDYLKNERLNSIADSEYRDLCKMLPAVERDDIEDWERLTLLFVNKNSVKPYIAFDDGTDYNSNFAKSTREDRVFERTIPVFVDGKLVIKIRDVIFLKRKYFLQLLAPQDEIFSCFSEKKNEISDFLFLNSFRR